MDGQKWLRHSLVTALFKRMVGLYPRRFRREFSGEIYEVVLQRLDEAGGTGGPAWLAAVFRETGALWWSVCRENLHEQWGYQEGSMKPYDLLEREVRAKQRRLRWMRIIRAVVVLAALVGLNQACVYAYGTVRLAQAKSLGVYPTPEEAARAVFNHPVDDVQVERFGGVNCGPNDPFGRQPFVWFCTARVKYDRVPDGSNSREFLPGSFFFQVQDGWVYMGEDLFLGVVTLAMERYHLEGVK